MAEKSFDYIIAGGGMAGLSLAFHLSESRLSRRKKILIIDRDAKTANDHTWCFWEKEKSAFEEIVFRKWKTLWFHGAESFSQLLDLGAYEYKMIRSADLYKFVFEKINVNPNFTFLQADIKEIESEKVKTSAGEFSANEFIFDSFTRKKYVDPKYQNLFQHFHGWLIETEQENFNAGEPTLFDFRVEQKNECRFVYILPFDEKKALIEFTVFSGDVLEKKEYEFYLRKYIAEILKIEKYDITQTEEGVIPMSDEPHEEFPMPKVIRIGTAGGYVKPSTGYSFQRTQRRLQKLVAALEKSSRIPGSEVRVWKNYLDAVLLNVLSENTHAADDVFTRLFAKNKTSQVLKFLDEDTNFTEDLQIMRTVPLFPFTKSAVKIAMREK